MVDKKFNPLLLQPQQPLNRLFLKENFHQFYRAAVEKSRNEKQTLITIG